MLDAPRSTIDARRGHTGVDNVISLRPGPVGATDNDMLLDARIVVEDDELDYNYGGSHDPHGNRNSPSPNGRPRTGEPSKLRRRTYGRASGSLKTQEPITMNEQGSDRTSHVDTFIIDNLPPRGLWPEMDYSVLPDLAAYPPQLNAATELLDQGALRFGDRPVVAYGSDTWSYSQLLFHANRIARVLVEDCGLIPGERVALRGANHPMQFAAWFAVLKAGGIAISTMPVLRRRELRYMMDKARVQLAISDIGLRDEIEAAARGADSMRRILFYGGQSPDGLESLMGKKPGDFVNVATRWDDPAVIGFTSGSTGTPKGTIHFHRDLLAAADTFARHTLGIRSEDVVCGSPQLAFLYGLCAYIPDTMRFGASVVLLERGIPEVLLRTIADRRVTVCFSTPSGFRAMLERIDDFDTSSLRLCVAGGEPMTRALLEQWEQKTGVRIINGLGISEMLHIFISATGDEIRPGKIGRAVPGFQVRVVDEQMRDTPPGEVGQMIVKGPHGCRYLDDVERQRAYVRNGWNLSGDLCRRDADGYITYEARTDDMILTGGYNVSGLEVEAVLLEHPKVLRCAVVGTPDAIRGEVVKAFVTLRDPAQATPATVRELQDFVKSQIAAFKYPRQVTFTDELPLTATGKIRRGELRARERERDVRD